MVPCHLKRQKFVPAINEAAEKELVGLFFAFEANPIFGFLWKLVRVTWILARVRRLLLAIFRHGRIVSTSVPYIFQVPASTFVQLGLMDNFYYYREEPRTMWLLLVVFHNWLVGRSVGDRREQAHLSK